MTVLDLIAAVLVLTALLAWLNARFLHFPTTIGAMALATAFSLALVVLENATHCVLSLSQANQRLEILTGISHLQRMAQCAMSYFPVRVSALPE